MDIRRVLRGLWRELKREKRAAESLPIPEERKAALQIQKDKGLE